MKLQCLVHGHWFGPDAVSEWVDTEDHPGGPPANDELTVKYVTTVRTCTRCSYSENRVTREVIFDV